MHFVCNVAYDSDYQLRITFEDGSVRLVDLKDHLDGKVFEPLKVLRHFRTAHLNQDLDTVVWDNGADMSPDFLYEIGVPLASNNPSAHLRVAEPKAEYKTTPLSADINGKVGRGRRTRRVQVAAGSPLPAADPG